jgi:hypothetical protein
LTVMGHFRRISRAAAARAAHMAPRAALPAVRKRMLCALNSLRGKSVVHLFLLSPPLCGSTVLQQLLSTSPHVTGFETEGQWLPELRHILGVEERWDEDLEIDWKEVRAVFNSYWSPLRKVRMEKSPPHIIRAGELERHFENSHFLVTMRNPYAQVEGQLRRGWIRTPRAAAEFWIRLARRQLKNLRELERCLLFTYEDLTGETDLTIRRLMDFLPALGSLSPRVEFSAHNVTGKPIRGLVNLNERKIASLSDEVVAEINGVLERNVDVMGEFGYTLLGRR